MPRPDRRPAATIVIPTRHRGQLACAALNSVIEQAADRITVVVSDNSDDHSDREMVERFCATQDPRLVHYLRPAKTMTMTAHWEWAMQRAMQISGATHFAFLTDRMIFKPGFLEELLQRSTRFPADVITYNYDMVEDSTIPIRLKLERWSGQLLAIDAMHLLNLSAHGIFSHALPRMLNTLVPRTLLAAIQQRFGSVFASVSPDVCFAYRCLAQVDRILYYDKAGLIQYAIGRSQGYNFHRGIAVRDVVDFATLQGAPTLSLSAAPVPQFQTMTNSVFHEYNVVRAEAGSQKFPAIERRAYLGAMAWDAFVLRDPERKRVVRQLLRENGWTAVDTLRWYAGKVSQIAVRDPRRLVDAVAGRMPQRRTFADVNQAIAWAIAHPRRCARSLAHQWQLRPRPVGEAEADGRNPDREALISA